MTPSLVSARPEELLSLKITTAATGVLVVLEKPLSYREFILLPAQMDPLWPQLSLLVVKDAAV